MWNLVFLQLLLEERGHEVINLGSCVPVTDLVAECLRHRPDALVLSSVNGHGHIDGSHAIRAIRATPDLREMRVIIGGLLGTVGDRNRQFVERLLADGFDGVFSSGSALADFCELLEETAPDPAALTEPRRP
jgi:methylmalonyl-CoA mutase cobalamin-binding subunit